MFKKSNPESKVETFIHNSMIIYSSFLGLKFSEMSTILDVEVDKVVQAVEAKDLSLENSKWNFTLSLRRGGK